MSAQIPRKTLANLLRFSLRHGLRDADSAPVVIAIIRRVFSRLGGDQMGEINDELANEIVKSESSGRPISGNDDVHEQWVQLYEWIQARIEKFR